MCLAYLCNGFTTYSESSSCIRKQELPCCFDKLWQICSLCAGGFHIQKEPWWLAGQWPGVENWPTGLAWLLASLWWPLICCPYETHMGGCFLQEAPCRAQEAAPRKMGRWENEKTSWLQRSWPPGARGLGEIIWDVGFRWQKRPILLRPLILNPNPLYLFENPFHFLSFFLFSSHFLSLLLFQSLSP